MSPQEIIEKANRWPRRIYFFGRLLCLLGLIGLGVLFLTPEDTLETWLTGTTHEVLEGHAGGHARLVPDTHSVGVPRNETAQPLDDASGLAPEALAEAPQKPPASPPVASPAQAPALVALAPQPVVAEQGMGEITIVALMPGARVNIADQVITKAPTTLRVPWPANYEVAVRLGDAMVYETRVRLTAENNTFSFAVEPDVGV